MKVRTEVVLAPSTTPATNTINRNYLWSQHLTTGDVAETEVRTTLDGCNQMDFILHHLLYKLTRSLSLCLPANPPSRMCM